MGTKFVRRFENFDSQSFQFYESSSSSSVDRSRSIEAIEEDKKQSLDDSMSSKSNNGEIKSNGKPNISTLSPKDGQIVPISII